jgi:hypothetical protein
MLKITRFNAKFALTAMTLVSVGLMATACARHPKAIPTWGGDLPPSAKNPAVVMRPTAPVLETSQAPVSTPWTGRSTFTQGCTGSFSVRDARTNRQISSGRAVNSGNGLIALDARGRQTRAVSSAPHLSVIFLPDCNCRLGGNQTGSVSSDHQFAATAPSAASCVAN